MSKADDIIVVDENGSIISGSEQNTETLIGNDTQMTQLYSIDYARAAISLLVFIIVLYFGIKTFVRRTGKQEDGRLFDDLSIEPKDVKECTIINGSLNLLVFELKNGDFRTIRMNDRAKVVEELEDNNLTVVYKD